MKTVLKTGVNFIVKLNSNGEIEIKEKYPGQIHLDMGNNTVIVKYTDFQEISNLVARGRNEFLGVE